jgi:hypothetical protein
MDEQDSISGDVLLSVHLTPKIYVISSRFGPLNVISPYDLDIR